MSVFLDRVIGMFAMLLMAASAVFLNWHFVMSKPQLASLALVIGLAIVLFVGFCLIVFTGHLDWIMHILSRFPAEKVAAFAQRVHAGMKSFRSQPTVVVKALLLSILSQSASITFIGLVAYLTKPGYLTLPALVFAVPLGFIVMVLPVSVAGIGVGQAAFYLLFKMYTGVGSQVGPNAITAFQLVQLSLGMVGAYFYLQRRHVLNMATVIGDNNVVDQRTCHSS